MSVIFNYGILHNKQPIKAGSTRNKKPSVTNLCTPSQTPNAALLLPSVSRRPHLLSPPPLAPSARCLRDHAAPTSSPLRSVCHCLESLHQITCFSRIGFELLCLIYVVVPPSLPQPRRPRATSLGWMPGMATSPAAASIGARMPGTAISATAALLGSWLPGTATSLVAASLGRANARGSDLAGARGRPRGGPLMVSGRTVATKSERKGGGRGRGRNNIFYSL